MGMGRGEAKLLGVVVEVETALEAVAAGVWISLSPPAPPTALPLSSCPSSGPFSTPPDPPSTAPATRPVPSPVPVVVAPAAGNPPDLTPNHPKAE